MAKQQHTGTINNYYMLNKQNIFENDFIIFIDCQQID